MCHRAILGCRITGGHCAVREELTQGKWAFGRYFTALLLLGVAAYRFAIPQVSSRRARSTIKPRRAAKRGWRRSCLWTTRAWVGTAGCVPSRFFAALILRVLREETCRRTVHADRSNDVTAPSSPALARRGWRRAGSRDRSFEGSAGKQRSCCLVRVSLPLVGRVNSQTSICDHLRHLRTKSAERRFVRR